MNNVYLGNEYLFSVPEKLETLFLSFCTAHDIYCQRCKEDDFVLFSPLRGTIVALSGLDNEDEIENKVVNVLADGLKSLGALVLYTTKNSSFNKLLQVLKVQIVLSFSAKEDDKEKGGIRFFYSLRHRAESQRVIAAIVRELAGGKKSVHYEIPGLIDYVLNPGNIKFYLADAPTILLEINKPDLKGARDSRWEEEISNAVLKGLLRLYGKPPGLEEFSLLKEMISLFMQEPETFSEESEAKREENRETTGASGDSEEISDEETPEKREEPEGFDPAPAIEPQDKKKPFQAAAAGKKSKRRHSSTCSLFPPPDGPVYQFNFQPKVEEVYGDISRMQKYDPQLPPAITSLFSDMTGCSRFQGPTPQTLKAREDLKERIETAKVRKAGWICDKGEDGAQEM